MKLKRYQWGELIGLLFLLASTATQIFYVEPLKREIEWRMAAFNMQQNGQLQMSAIYGNRIATLHALKVPDAEISLVEAERDTMIKRYRTADANVSDYLIEKESVEGNLQIVVLVFFAIGMALAGFGRAMEMSAASWRD
ncbi:MAG: hypothetical protein KJZ80_16690 [Hyphomicrobiaceae bacterium]|nr:hypothetical protein [Hyphomicrobiaceae bacterium]